MLATKMQESKPILQLIVVGFHHKKGYQVEYSYPAFDKSDDSTECPSGWKFLPSLALPDGSHNFVEDSVFFNLPSLTDPNETVYGVSCYRQIPVEKLKIRTADVTRSTVQKAVCALASMPLYGYIEVKLTLIAQAFFDQGDFSNTKIIRRAYDQLNACLCDGFIGSTPLQHIHVGLPIRDIILRWRYKLLILFKLILLQRKVICFGSPVRPNCSLILGILSLHPELLENGFRHVTNVSSFEAASPLSEAIPIQSDVADHSAIVDDDSSPEKYSSNFDRKISVSEAEQNNLDLDKEHKSGDSSYDKPRTERNSLPRDASAEALASTLLPLCSISPKLWGAPLPLFNSGMLCLPYLSLSYMDLLTDASVKGYIIGTSNILFRQKRQLFDVLIDVETASMETQDAELRRQLSLSTEDLRFMDFVLRQVQTPKEDAEGSEQWIRRQFQGYMLALLKTAVIAPEGAKECEHFNGSFVTAWKLTNGYKDWVNANHHGQDFNWDGDIIGHPFAGNLSVGDMKLKIAQTMNNSESGRKLNQAVNTTSKAVGGALSQAKNWWLSMITPPIIADTPPKFPEDSYEASAPEKDSMAEKVEPSNENSNACNISVENEEATNGRKQQTTATTPTRKSNDNQNCHQIVEIGHEADVLNVHKDKSEIINK